MGSYKFLTWILILVLLVGFLGSVEDAHANPPYLNLAQSSLVTAYDLIAAMNSLRMANGLPALLEDPIVNSVAQATAEIMAANQMSWHIGDVRGRIAAAGYGGGATVWATENFAVGNLTIDEIMVIWSDADHMRPAVTPAYCHVGAGVAQTSDGKYYYVLQAAYASGVSCEASPSSSVTHVPGAYPVYGFITPVKIATPDADGMIYHVVETGQSLWSIAIAYKVTVRDLQNWNNLATSTIIQTGQRLFIPSSSTKGYATPTPVGMIVPSTPDAEGKIIHIVQPYNNLIKIAEAYNTSVETILALNGLQIDWPLQVGQKLIIYPGNVTPSPTPRPLTPIEKLTPSSDGKYYHTVKSGETLSWIAGLYNVALADLMAWNGLNSTSIIYPEQQLILQVTPPAAQTFTPGPPTATAPATATNPPPTATQTPTRTMPSPTVTAAPVTQAGKFDVRWAVLIFLAAGGLIVLGLVLRKKTH
jgi:LysM repeat protein